MTGRAQTRGSNVDSKCTSIELINITRQLLTCASVQSILCVTTFVNINFVTHDCVIHSLDHTFVNTMISAPQQWRRNRSAADGLSSNHRIAPVHLNNLSVHVPRFVRCQLHSAQSAIPWRALIAPRQTAPAVSRGCGNNVFKTATREVWSWEGVPMPRPVAAHPFAPSGWQPPMGCLVPAGRKRSAPKQGRARRSSPAGYRTPSFANSPAVL